MEVQTEQFRETEAFLRLVREDFARQGVGNLEAIARTVGTHRLLAGVGLLGVTRQEEGRIIYAGRGVIYIGAPAGSQVSMIEMAAVVDLFRGAGLECQPREDIEAVALAYGLCGCGTAGLQPRRHKFVIPRAHDCIALFMGSKDAYAEQQRLCPTCYYYTPGWNRERRVPFNLPGP